MRYGKNSDLSLPQNGSLWFGSQDSLNDAISTQIRLGDMSMVEMSDMRIRAVEMRSGFGGAEEGYAGHYMVDTFHEGRVASLSIQGALMHHPLPLRMFGLPVTTYGEIQEALMMLANDANVEHILLTVGSGGGSGHGLFRTSNLIERVSKQKRVDTFTDTNMGSAAYWMGVIGKKIYAEPLASVGSIGVYMTMVSNFEKNREEGREVKIIRAGEYKALGLSDEQITEKAVGVWQEEVNKAYGAFLDHTSGHRGMQREDFRVKAAEGRVFSGQEAVQAGLVDELMVFDDVIVALKPAKSKAAAPVSVAGRKPMMNEGAMNKHQLKLLEKMGIALTSEQQSQLASGLGFDQIGLDANVVAELTKLNDAKDEDEGGDKTATVLTEKQLAVLTAEGVSLSDEQKTKLEGGAAVEDLGLAAEVVAKLNAADKEPATPAAKADAPEGLMALVQQVAQLSTDLATANLKLQAAESKLETVNTQLANSEEQLKLTRTIVASSINRLELGMRTGLTAGMDNMTVEQLTQKYEETKSKFEGMFPASQKSTTAVSTPVAAQTRDLPADLELAVANASKI